MTATRHVFVRRAGWLVLAVLASLGPVASGSGFSLFRNYWGDVIVATDTTAEGRKLEPASPAKPVYYLGRSLGAKLGTIGGDEMPDAKELSQVVAKILAKQGYVGARPGVDTPTLFLVLQWGYLRPESGDLRWFLGYNTADDIAAPAMPGQLGPEVWRRNFRSRDTETILQTTDAPIYAINVTAFDYATARTPHPIICWQTRIGLPANGKSMAEALPTMLIAAGPAIGKPSDKPVLLDTDHVREGKVSIGEDEVIDSPFPTQPPAADRKP